MLGFGGKERNYVVDIDPIVKDRPDGHGGKFIAGYDIAEMELISEGTVSKKEDRERHHDKRKRRATLVAIVSAAALVTTGVMGYLDYKGSDMKRFGEDTVATAFELYGLRRALRVRSAHDAWAEKIHLNQQDVNRVGILDHLIQQGASGEDILKAAQEGQVPGLAPTKHLSRKELARIDTTKTHV